MTEVWVAQRLGETIAAIWDAGRLIEMHMERDGDGAPPGSHWAARLKTHMGARGIAILQPSGEEVVVEPLPPSLPQGALLKVEISRQAWREPGRDRLAKARPVRPNATPASTDLAVRLKARGLSPTEQPFEQWPAEIADAWDSGWEAAELGTWTIPGGRLAFTPTPALVAVDVDGIGANLAVDAATAAARIIRLWGIGGVAVIDLPTRGKEERQAVAATIDRELASAPFERTAVNGFGLLQLVMPRHGPSILERARLERDATTALRLLGAAVAEPRPGTLAIVASPAPARWLLQRPHLLAEAAKRTGRRVDVVADPMAGEGHVETRP